MENQTSGPWYGANVSGGQGLVCDEKTGRNIAVVYDKKDTQLIAAAPDLLFERDRLREINAGLVEALQAIEARIDGVWDHPALVKIGPLFSDETVDVARISRAALNVASCGMAGGNQPISPTPLDALKSVIEWTDNETNIPSDRLLMLIRNCAIAAIEAQGKAPDENLKDYRVSLHADPSDKYKIHFDCLAEDREHAIEQAENVYPGCEVMHICRFKENDNHSPDKEVAAELLACVLDVLDANGDLHRMDFSRYRIAVSKAEEAQDVKSVFATSFPSPGGC